MTSGQLGAEVAAVAEVRRRRGRPRLRANGPAYLLLVAGAVVFGFPFYWLVIGVICLFGLSGIFAGLTAMAISPFAGFLVVLESIAGVVVGVVFSRIAAELILIVFRINEHLGAIRDQGGGMR